MDLVQACLKADGRLSVNTLRKMISTARPSAIWAILMHAASWNEQRTYDTPHSTIMLYATHRMIEDMGKNPDLLEGDPRRANTLRAPDELKHLLQNALIERLSYHLADIDHWKPENGPKYNVETTIESMGNAVQNFGLSVRKKSLTGTLKSAITLASKGEPIHLRRAAATIAAEKPDSLGHGFIMPVSLLMEIPEPAFTRPQIASLWHLAEFLVRKVPSTKIFTLGPSISKYAAPYNMSVNKAAITSAVVNYGTLGHNAIFAHRIAEASRLGLVESEVVDWLVKKLKENTGAMVKIQDLDIAKLIEDTKGADWSTSPAQLRLPSSTPLRDWLEANTDFWSEMMDLKSKAFEQYLLEASSSELDLIRVAQYAMSAINGEYSACHTTIFTQSVWNLVDQGLVSENIAALQVHRMQREYLNEK